MLIARLNNVGQQLPERSDTLFLRFIAIFLVTNSHLDALYPWPFLAGGGALGNSFFFMLSGLGLALSYTQKPLPPFLTWQTLRSLKIYPALWIVLIGISMAHNQWQTDSPFLFLANWVYPTPFWFLSALLIFYVVLFPVLKYRRITQLPLYGMLLLLPIYFYFYCTAIDLHTFSVENAGYFKWLFYAQVMLFGVWLAPRYTRFKSPKVWDYVLLGTFGVLYIGLKYTLAKGSLLPAQFLLQWTTLPIVYLALKIARAAWVPVLLHLPGIGALLTLMSTCTLEIYLLQHELYSAAYIRQLSFPWNIGTFWLLLLSFSWTVHQVSSRIQKNLVEALQKKITQSLP